MRYTQDEWNRLIAGYPPGTSVSGTVRACQVFGVFVLLDELPDVPCLLEVIHFAANESSPCQSIQFPVDYPSVGERITARILAWSEKTHDVRLTQLSHLNWVYINAAKANHSE
jgi:ribosomal protein S1